MGSIEIFDHTADVGFRIRAATLDDLFATAAEAMFDYIVANREAVRTSNVVTLELQADSTPDLLASWLEELLFRSETEHVLYARFDPRLGADGLSLVANVGGEAIDRDRHILDHEVKAVTRYGFFLIPEGDGWIAEMILDI